MKFKQVIWRPYDTYGMAILEDDTVVGIRFETTPVHKLVITDLDIKDLRKPVVPNVAPQV